MSTILIVANQTLPSEALATDGDEPDRVRHTATSTSSFRRRRHRAAG